MAKTRKAVAYRRLERPYTRISKYRKKNFIRANPNIHIVRYDMGDPTRTYTHTLNLVSKGALQIRHNAIESARLTCNRYMEAALGKKDYYLKLRKYPHHILRENPLASGAGADRMSTGMKCSFGKPIGHAIQVRPGDEVMTIKIDKDKLDLAKKALKRASYKFPSKFQVVISENK